MIVLLNEAGAIITRLTIPLQVTGFEKLDEAQRQLGVGEPDCLLSMETAHNILIDFLPGQPVPSILNVRYFWDRPPRTTRSWPLEADQPSRAWPAEPPGCGESFLVTGRVP